METQEKEGGYADQMQGRLDMCLEQIEMLRAGLVGTAPDDPHAEAVGTKAHVRKLCGVTLLVGANVGGLISSEDVEHIDSVRGRRAHMCDTRRGHKGAQGWSERSGHRASQVPITS